MVTCPTYTEKFVRDSIVAPFLLLSVVIVTVPYEAAGSWHLSQLT